MLRDKLLKHFELFDIEEFVLYMCLLLLLLFELWGLHLLYIFAEVEMFLCWLHRNYNYYNLISEEEPFKKNKKTEYIINRIS